MANVDLEKLALEALFDDPAAILHKQAASPPPAELFHFTDAAGFIGIVESRTLWASLVTALNDSSEFIYALDLARELLRAEPAHLDADFRESVLKMLDPDAEPRRVKLTWRVYAASFCATADSALQWLHYGHKGTGVALAFDSQRILLPGFDLLPVIYDPREQGKFLDEILTAIWSKVKEVADGLPSPERRAEFISLVGEIASNQVAVAASRFKNPAFADEREWRLVTHDLVGIVIPAEKQVDLPVHVREISGRTVPYVHAKYAELPLTQVLLGAASPMNPADQALRILFETAKAPYPRVGKSTVPVRP